MAVDTPTSAPDRLRWAALFVILAAEVMDLLDALVTGIAGPSIVRELGGDGTTIQWLQAAYTVAMAAGLLIGGRLGDLVGRRRMFLLGMTGFTLFSLVCAAAPSPGVLLAARAVQGLFGALLLPQGLGMIRELFPPHELAKAFGAFGPVMGASAVGGPVLAGWLVDADLLGLGWRAIFAINVPIGLAALASALRVLPADRPDRSVGLDWRGALLASSGMLLLIFPLVQGRELGWPLWTLVMPVLAVGVLVLFVRSQIARDRTGRSTLVVPTLLGRKAFVGGMATGLAFFGALMGTSLVYSLLLQWGLQLDPLHAGLGSLPQALGMMVGFGLAQPLNARLGRKLLQLGTLVVLAGTAWTVLALLAAGDALTVWHLVPAGALIGIGMGLVMAPFFDIVMAAVDDRESGSASGTLTSVQQIGGAFGVAVLGTVLFHGAGPGSDLATWSSAAVTTYLVAVPFLLAVLALTLLLPRRAREGAGH